MNIKRQKIAILVVVATVLLVVPISGNTLTTKRTIYPGSTAHGVNDSSRGYLSHYEPGRAKNSSATYHANVVIPLQKTYLDGYTNIAVLVTIYVYDHVLENISCTLYSGDNYHSSYSYNSGSSSGTGGNTHIDLGLDTIYSSYSVFCQIPDVETYGSYINRVVVTEYFSSM